MAAAGAASRRGGPGGSAGRDWAAAVLPAAPGPPGTGTMDCYTANWNPLGEEAFYR